MSGTTADTNQAQPVTDVETPSSPQNMEVEKGSQKIGEGPSSKNLPDNHARHQPTGEPAVPSHERIRPASSSNGLRINYRIDALAGSQTVMVLESGFELPRATEPEFIPLADASCSKLFELLVATPLQIGIRAYLQRRFDELRAQPKETAARAGTTWAPSGNLQNDAEDEQARALMLKPQHSATDAT